MFDNLRSAGPLPMEGTSKTGRERPRRRRSLRFRPGAERLESLMLLATVNWTNPAGGAWDIAGNWDLGRLPAAGDDVVINVPTADVTITHATGSDSIHSLTSSEKFNLSGGTLDVATTVQESNNFTLSGGTLADATVASGTTIIGTTAGGTLAGVTLAGTLDLTTAGNAYVAVAGGLTLPGGTVNLGGTTNHGRP